MIGAALEASGAKSGGRAARRASHTACARTPLNWAELENSGCERSSTAFRRAVTGQVLWVLAAPAARPAGVAQ
jgi:hypothetical protein